jgi:hypothetical protein
MYPLVDTFVCLASYRGKSSNGTDRMLDVFSPQNVIHFAKFEISTIYF